MTAVAASTSTSPASSQVTVVPSRTAAANGFNFDVRIFSPPHKSQKSVALFQGAADVTILLDSGSRVQISEIVAVRSCFLASVLRRGEFLESVTRTFDFSDWDGHAVCRVIDFLKTDLEVNGDCPEKDRVVFQFPIAAEDCFEILSFAAYLALTPVIDLCVSMIRDYLSEGDDIDADVFVSLPFDIVARCVDHLSATQLCDLERRLSSTNAANLMPSIWLSNFTTAVRSDAALVCETRRALMRAKEIMQNDDVVVHEALSDAQVLQRVDGAIARRVLTDHAAKIAKITEQQTMPFTAGYRVRQE